MESPELNKQIIVVLDKAIKKGLELMKTEKDPAKVRKFRKLCINLKVDKNR